MAIRPLGAQSIGYKSNINDSTGNTTFTGAAQSSSPDIAPKQKVKRNNSRFAKLMTNISLVCMGTLALLLAATKIQLSKNLKSLSEKLGEASKKQIQTHLHDYSLSSKKQITDELIKSHTLKNMPQNKINDLITNIATRKTIKKQNLMERIIDILWIVP